MLKFRSDSCLSKQNKSASKFKINIGLGHENSWRIWSSLNEHMRWVSDCCLTLIQQFFSYIWREQVNYQWDDDEVRFVLDQHAELDFHNASSETTVRG